MICLSNMELHYEWLFPGNMVLKAQNQFVKIEFLEKQPATYWNTINAYEYDFEANVNPN